VNEETPIRLSGKMVSVPIARVVCMNTYASDEVTITLRKDELRDLVVSLTAMLDSYSLEYEHIADRFPILANGFDRLCHQAQKAGVPIFSDESAEGGAA